MKFFYRIFMLQARSTIWQKNGYKIKAIFTVKALNSFFEWGSVSVISGDASSIISL